MARILPADRARGRPSGATTTRPRRSFGHPSPDVPDLAPTRAPPLSSTPAGPAVAGAPSYSDGTHLPPDGKTCSAHSNLRPPQKPRDRRAGARSRARLRGRIQGRALVGVTERGDSKS